MLNKKIASEDTSTETQNNFVNLIVRKIPMRWIKKSSIFKPKIGFVIYFNTIIFIIS